MLIQILSIVTIIVGVQGQFSRQETSIVKAEALFTRDLSVHAWKTFDLGLYSYSAGFVANTSRIAALSTRGPSQENWLASEIMEIGQNVSDFGFFRQYWNGQQQVFLVTYSSSNRQFSWYPWIENRPTNIPVFNLSIEHHIGHFQIFEIQDQSFLLAAVNDPVASITIYSFRFPIDIIWARENILLEDPVASSCVIDVKDTAYLLVAQPVSGKVTVFAYREDRFKRINVLESANVSQVVCFENGFESFFAFNGADPKIFLLRNDDRILERSPINGHLEGVDFWLPLPVSIYREETLLLFQRNLDHDSHTSLDVGVITYDGKDFHEHPDVPCKFFEDSSSDLNCISKYNPQDGIRGASYLVRYDRYFLIVPTSHGTSVVLSLDIEFNKVNPKEEQLEHIVHLQEHLEGTMKNQNERLTRIREQDTTDNLKARNSAASHVSPETYRLIEEVQQLKELFDIYEDVIKARQFNTIIFNGPVIVDSLSTPNITMENLLLDDIVQRDHLTKIHAEKTIGHIKVEDLSFLEVNGIALEDFAHKVSDNGQLILEGHLSVNGSAQIDDIHLTSGTFNGKSVNDWSTIHDVAGQLTFEELEARNSFTTDNEHFNLTVPGNVTVGWLNGQQFDEFLATLCLNGQSSCRVPKLSVDGILRADDTRDVDFLNDLAYPGEYVPIIEPEEVLKITGRKRFTNVTKAHTISTDGGTVNGVDLREVVNIAEHDLRIGGTIQFDSLEVGKELKIDGNVTGDITKEFVMNRDLRETDTIKANVEFENLEVWGDIIIDDSFNGTDFAELLENFVNQEERTTITGAKILSRGLTVMGNLDIASNSINNISMESFVTKNTDQEIETISVTGNIQLDHLFVSGLVADLNVTELNESLIKTDEDNQIKSRLIFEDDAFVEALIINTPNQADLRSLPLDRLELVDVLGNITCNLNGFPLEDFHSTFLNYYDEQHVTETWFIDELTVDHLAAVDDVNSLPYSSSFVLKSFIENVTKILTYYNGTVNSFRAGDHLKISKINQVDAGKLQNNIWIRIHQKPGTLVIDGNVRFPSLQIDELANVSFNELVDSLIFKKESHVEIENSIVFENTVRVNRLLETATLNNVQLTNILRKEAEQTVRGPITIVGDALIEDDVTVREKINDVELTYMLNNFDIGEEDLQVKGEIFFNHLSFIRNLTVHGLINGKSFDAIRDNFAFIDKDLALEKSVTFHDNVTVNGNLQVSEDVNGVILSEFYRNVVWLTQDASIEGPIKFIEPVHCLDTIFVGRELNVSRLYGNDLEKVLSESVFVTNGTIAGRVSFENVTIYDEIITKFINNIDMKDVIPLKSAQKLGNLTVGSLMGLKSFDVGKRVNGANLSIESERTFTSKAKQNVRSNIEFSNHVLVEDNLAVRKLNGKPASKIVTIDTEQTLNASYNFEANNVLNKNLMVTGLINGVNLTRWNDSIIAADSPHAQHIKSDFSMQNLDVRSLSSDNASIVGDVNIAELVGDVERNERHVDHVEQRGQHDYKVFCEELSVLSEHVKQTLSYRFKYFEETQTLPFSSRIQYVKHFEHRRKHYLLVGEDRSCDAKLFAFSDGAFVGIKTIKMGQIEEVAKVSDEYRTFLVVRRSEIKCPNHSDPTVLVWELADDDLKVFDSVEAPLDQLHESQEKLHFFGLKGTSVTEYRIDSGKEPTIVPIRRWNLAEAHDPVDDDQPSFVASHEGNPLVVRTNAHIFLLDRSDLIAEDGADLYTETVTMGNFTKIPNVVFPGTSTSSVPFQVGVGETKRTLRAVANTNPMRKAKHYYDTIDIYSDAFTGDLFDRIYTFKPSALAPLRFANGETLLAFLENGKTLQIYEYKGIEGFRKRSSTNIEAQQLHSFLDLPSQQEDEITAALGLQRNDKLVILRAIMAGRKIENDLRCSDD